MLRNWLFAKLIRQPTPPTEMAESPPRIDDFERSPLRFEMEALLEEYRALRQEIIQHEINRQQISNFSIGIIAATIAILQFLPGDPDLLSIGQSGRAALPLLSLLFSALALACINQDAMAATNAAYIDAVLGPRVKSILSQVFAADKEIWEWEVFRAKFQYQSSKALPFFGVMAAANYALTLLPAILCIIAYAAVRRGNPAPLWQDLLFGLALIAFFWALATGIFSGTIYYSAGNSPKQGGQEQV